MASVHLIDHHAVTPLDTLVGDYLDNCRARGVSPRTARCYSQSLDGVFLPWCREHGITSIEQLDRHTCNLFTSDLLTRISRYGRPLSKYSVHSYVAPVRQLILWAKAEGETVGAMPQRPRRGRIHRDVLSRDEITRMESAVPSERDKLIIRIFADCGLRLSELLALTTTSVVRSGHTASLDVHGKGDRQRRVPLVGNLQRRIDQLIRTLPADRESSSLWLSLRRGRSGRYEPLTESGVFQVVRDAAQRAGITRSVHPHLLRHSWMTEMLRRGMNPLQLRVIAGASPEVIARHYAHLTEADAHIAMVRAFALPPPS